MDIMGIIGSEKPLAKWYPTGNVQVVGIVDDAHKNDQEAYDPEMGVAQDKRQLARS